MSSNFEEEDCQACKRMLRSSCVRFNDGSEGAIERIVLRTRGNLLGWKARKLADRSRAVIDVPSFFLLSAGTYERFGGANDGFLARGSNSKPCQRDPECHVEVLGSELRLYLLTVPRIESLADIDLIATMPSHLFELIRNERLPACIAVD